MSVIKKLSSIAFDVIGQFFFPPLCPGCACRISQSGTVCYECWAQLQFLTKPLCPILGIPLPLDLGVEYLSGEALTHPPPFDHARAVIAHKGLGQKLVSRFKYNNHSEFASWMALWMLRSGYDLIAECDLIIPIPLHPWRFWQRGYNQSADLARIIAKKTAKSFHPEILLRKKYTRPQVGLNIKQRQKNIYGIFTIGSNRMNLIKNKHIILIDDVYTTGATVKEATKLLKHHGAKRVDILTFSRVIPS